ncbi:MAG: hypothetical protein KatS3mg002_1493 [Candidatus Woesearchaeota archaeon]|nr:MAG: hypothetical protein KatS3mg002_1493 [Candidatus Woesearchaeota archaeon]
MNKDITIIRSPVCNLSSLGWLKVFKEYYFKIIGLDIREFLSIYKHVDFFYIIPSVKEKQKLQETFLTLIEKHKVKWLILGVEEEIKLLLEIENDINNLGAKFFHPPLETMKIITDKYSLFKKLSNKVLLPDTFKLSEIKDFNVINNYSGFILKPTKGRGSTGVKYISSLKELSDFECDKYDYIVQSYIIGDEYSVDVLFDMNGHLLNAIPRKRILVESGISIITETIKDYDLIELCKEIGRELFFRGCLNFQFIKKNDLYYLIDINPRFGGGSIISFYSSRSFRKNLISLLTCKNKFTINFNDVKPIRMERYFLEEFIGFKK